MPEDGVQNPTEFQYYVTRHGVRSDYSKRTPEQLVRDVNVLHDFTRKLVREKDSISKQLRRAQRRLDVAGWKLWALGIVVTGEGAVIGWLVKAFFERMR
jgi:hypothetical protein